MGVIDILMLACLILLLALYAHMSGKLRQVMRHMETASTGVKTIHAAVTVFPALAMCAVPIPLPLFYLLLYGVGWTLAFTACEQDRWEWLYINIRFLIFTTPQLIVVGAMALCAGTDVAGVLENFTLRVACLAVTMLLNNVLAAVLVGRLSGGTLNSQYWKSEELRLFSRFVWFCVCSVFFDSIPCLFSLPSIFALIFLIGSNLLLLLMAFLFARHVYTIIRDSDLKEEALRLWEEAMEQHTRTVQMERSAHLDTLTKVYTRRYAISNMGSMLGSGEGFSLVFLDLDRLKQINDREGHLAGDEYLRAFSERMKVRLRPNDIFARYGGDEFLILMPDLPLETASEQLIRIQSEASGTRPEGWGIPFSYGLVEARPDAGMSPEEWISVADRAMYEDKRRRREEREGNRL